MESFMNSVSDSGNALFRPLQVAHLERTTHDIGPKAKVTELALFLQIRVEEKPEPLPHSSLPYLPPSAGIAASHEASPILANLGEGQLGIM